MNQKRIRPLVGAILMSILTNPAAGMAAYDPPSKVEPNPAMIAAGSRSAIDTPRNRIVKDKADFAMLWLEHTAHENPAPVPPDVDFSESTVAAVFAGNQPTGGYSLTLTGLDKTPGGWVVRLSLVTPGPDCMTTQVITQPWAMVRVPGHDQPINIQVSPTQSSCGP